MIFLIIHTYFDKRRGIAVAAVYFGYSLGQTSWPPLVRFLQNEFGFRGALLILGAFMLHSFIGISFFHPVKWHTKKPQKQDETEAPTQKNELNEFKSATKSIDEFPPDTAAFQDSFRPTEDSQTNPNTSVTSHNKMSIYSTKDLKDSANKNKKTTFAKSENKKAPSSSMCQKLAQVFRSTASDMRILRSRRACIIVTCSMFFTAAYYNFLMMMPFYMQAEGYSLDDAAWCLSVYSFCCLSRILSSFLSDYSWFNKRGCYNAGYLLASSGMFCELVFKSIFFNNLAVLVTRLVEYGQPEEELLGGW